MRQHHDTNVVAFSKPSIWFNQFPSPLKQNHRYYSIYWKFIRIIVVFALIVYIRHYVYLVKPSPFIHPAFLNLFAFSMKILSAIAFSSLHTT